MEKVDLHQLIFHIIKYEWDSPVKDDMFQAIDELAILRSENAKLRKVADAARATLSFTDIGCGCDLQVNWICGPCALDKYLKELDGDK